MKTLGQRIRERREELGMTQEGLAMKMGYNSRASVNKVETDARGLSIDLIEKYAKALDCDPAYLACWQDEVRRDPEKEHARRVSVYAEKILQMQKELNALAESVKDDAEQLS